MKLIICAALLLAFCGCNTKDGTPTAKKELLDAYDAIGRVSAATSVSDLEARVRDAEASRDTARRVGSDEQIAAIEWYLVAARAQSYQPDKKELQVCMEEADAAIHHPVAGPVRGQCEKMISDHALSKH